MNYLNDIIYFISVISLFKFPRLKVVIPAFHCISTFLLMVLISQMSCILGWTHCLPTIIHPDFYLGLAMALLTCKQNGYSYFHNVCLVLLSSDIFILTKHNVKITYWSAIRKRDCKLSLFLNFSEIAMNKPKEHVFKF